MPAELTRDTVRRFVDAVLNRGNLLLARELLTPDFIDHHGFLGCSLTADGFEAALAALRAAFPDAYYRVDEFIVDGPRAVVQMTFHGTHRGLFKGRPPTGRKITVAGVHVFRLEDARLREHWAYENVTPLLDLAPGVLPTVFADVARPVAHAQVIW